MGFSTEFEPGVEIHSEHWVVAVLGHRVLLRNDNGQLLHRFCELQERSIPIVNTVHLGVWQGESCFVVELEGDDSEVHCDYVVAGLRSQLHRLDCELFALAGRALQLLHWRSYHRFCGYCGVATKPLASERVLQCERCETLFYPKISPCVIGIIVRGDQCLLAHNAHFPDGMFSAIAGFIDPGETAEAALQREIYEEVGLVVDGLEYITSQSWPFPSQLMLGYLAEYRSGEIQVDGIEIVEADWFSADNLPQVPPPQTIAGLLIQTFVNRVQGNRHF